MAEIRSAPRDLPRDPSTPAEWRDAVTAAATAICMHQALALGVVESAPHVNLERCLDVLRRGLMHGALPDLLAVRLCLAQYGIRCTTVDHVGMPEWAQQYRALRAVEGKIYAVDALAFGRAAIVGPCNQYGYENQWMYRSEGEAIAELFAWDGTGEPQGWTRHMPSGRH